MDRSNRLALMAAAVMLLVVTGTVLATRAPGAADEPAQLTASQGAELESEDAPPTAEELSHAADRLSAREIAFDDAALADLASRYGLGGAVRLFAWADATGRSVDDLAAMHDTGGPDGGPMGWGKIAKELGVSPGIGSIMGNGGGHGRDTAPGQQKAPGADEGSGE